MKNIFKYLKLFSTIPLEVDKLIVSAYMHVNKIYVDNNILLKAYYISEEDLDNRKKVLAFVDIIKKEIDVFNIEKLIELFEFVISPSDRVVTGAIYTPDNIRTYIVSQILERKKGQLHNAKIADIACGCSGFLYTAAKELKKITGDSYSKIFQNQLFGLDIQGYSITRSKLLLSLLAISEGEDIREFKFNLHQGDALSFKWEDHYDNFDGFQIIIGNPPYVCARNLEDSVKNNLHNWSVCNAGNTDLYIPFFQIGYENLAINGVLGFITMNTFFKSLNGRILREYFAKNRVKFSIIDFGTLQIFKSKSTYTCICFIEKSQQSFIKYYKSPNAEFPQSDENFEHVYYSRLDSFKGWNLQDNKIISKIESKGRPFGEVYNTRHGIATLRNDIYIFSPVNEDDRYYYIENNGVYPIEKEICKDILNSNKLSREVALKDAIEKIIFPYTYNSEEKPCLLNENALQILYPHAYAYLEDKRNILAKRDKGKGKYENWYAFGRTQSLERVRNKLFFPKMSNQSPFCIINSDENLLFYNGQAIVGHTIDEMVIIKKIMESKVFWYYIKTTSKPYSSSYYSLNGNYINNFGICRLSIYERKFVLEEQNKDLLDAFFLKKYGVEDSI